MLHFEILQKNTISFIENNFSVLFRYNSTKTRDFIPNKLERNPLSNKLYYKPSSIQQILIEVYIILFICQNFSYYCIYLIVVFFIPKIELNIVYYSPIILIQFRFYKTYIRSLFFWNDLMRYSLLSQHQYTFHLASYRVQ